MELLSCQAAELPVDLVKICQDAAMTKIRASDLPQVGGKEMQARECAALFEKLWKEDMQHIWHILAFTFFSLTCVELGQSGNALSPID